jgi:predicted nucleic acid-binding Zn ribbon protein
MCYKPVGMRQGSGPLRLLALRQRCKRVMRGHAQWHEVAQIAGQHSEIMDGRGGGDCQVGESRAPALAPGAVGQPAGDARDCHVKRQNARAIKVQQRLQPFCQSGGFPARTLTAGFGYAVRARRRK